MGARHVRIVGTGLLGTSIGLALRAHGVDVSLADVSPTSAALAADMGAGRLAGPQDAPDLVVVAAPPDVVADVVRRELATYPQAVVTDVASVKQSIARALADDVNRDRYVGSHPMAGRERSGAVAARSDLFEGRTWVVCGQSDLVEWLAQTCGARVTHLDAAAHDEAVAAVSHVPQLAASLVAAQLRELPEEAVALSGQGIRDVTRIAASDPMLWTQILAGNAQAVRPIVERMIDELGDVRDALGSLDDPDAGAARIPGPRAVLAQTIARGQDGHARIPGKHGGAPTTYATIAVVIPDEPGALGRLFTHAGETGVSIEDIRIEHDSAVNAGLLELDVMPARVSKLSDALRAHGWQSHVLDLPST